MRVYTKIVIDMESLEVLEENSYEYQGPVSRCDGGGNTFGGGGYEGAARIPGLLGGSAGRLPTPAG